MMMDDDRINETVAEVLRLDANATPGPWESSCGYVRAPESDDPTEMLLDGSQRDDADLAAYYRTASPAMAREAQRLQAEVERLKAEIQPRIERSIAFQDAMEEAEAERDEARAEVMRLREVRQRGCDCSDEDACRFARERDEARADVERLQAEVERLGGASLSGAEVE